MDASQPRRRLPLRWENPPQPLTRAEEFEQEWSDAAAMLKERRGEWAVLAEFHVPAKASSLAAKIRRGDVAPFINDGASRFEASQHTRPTEPGDDPVATRRVTVYARYVVFDND